MKGSVEVARCSWQFYSIAAPNHITPRLADHCESMHSGVGLQRMQNHASLEKITMRFHGAMGLLMWHKDQKCVCAFVSAIVIEAETA